MMTKHARQQAILRLVRDHDVSTQTRLVNALGVDGIAGNLSTVSRDIKDLGLVKTPRPDGSYCYSVPTNIVALTERSIRILREFVTSVNGAGQLAVVHTGSGNADPVAEAIDRLDLDNVVGTVAGDNTLLVIGREGIHWQQFREELESWL